MIAIITGASRGIGFSIASHFAAAGYKLLLNSLHDANLNEAIQKLKKEYPNSKIEGFAADLSDEKQVQKFAEWCLNFGNPSILINNAGMYLPGDCLTEADGTLEKMIKVNLYSAYNLTKAIVPQMIKAKSGHVFNVCSIAALKAYPGGGSYSISKYALHGFTQNLREELKSHHVKVTGVYPGAVYTDSWVGFDNSSARIMEVDDIAKMIVSASQLSPAATVEEIVIRPQLGDL